VQRRRNVKGNEERAILSSMVREERTGYVGGMRRRRKEGVEVPSGQYRKGEFLKKKEAPQEMSMDGGENSSDSGRGV